MAYRLALDLDTPDALRACAREQLEDAVHELREGRADDPVKAVHEARKDLKKARALLRLARPGMPRKRYRHENSALRDAGRLLSGARDADVLAATAKDLGERYAGQLPEAMFEALHARLVAEAAAAHRHEVDDAVGGATGALEAAVARIDDWPVDRCDGRTLVAGAARAYTRGLDALTVAEDTPSVARLHELRKRVKDLWYHGRLLEETWPRVVKAHSREAHELADLLGDDHDLAVLAERLERGLAADDGTVVDDDAVLELIARRRAELQEEAVRLARRLYAERPKAFARRVGAYVRLGAAEARVAEPV
jgi:CHAD domain-containing protein